ncbi:MAG: hypothetical protein Kow0099_20760 [Candidatus Abyssubacteria bacterium]
MPIPLAKGAEVKKKRIGELLVEAGYVSAEQIGEALEIQKTTPKRICAILLDLGYLNEESYLDFMKKTLSTATIELKSCRIDKDVLDLIPRDLAVNLEAVPVSKIGNMLTVAMACPLDVEGQKRLESQTGMKVRPVLCAQSAIRSAIENHYETPKEDDGAEDEATHAENYSALAHVIRLVNVVDELPTLPEIVGVVSSIANDPNSSAADLAKVIESDGSLSAKILKLANSAAYGFSRRISSVHNAVALLGFKETQALVTSVKVFDYFVDRPGLDFRNYWNHALTCATLTRLLALNLKSRETENAFVAGLLHDVGKLVLAMADRGAIEGIHDLCSDGVVLSRHMEEELLGVSHAEVGYLLADHWLLPESLSATIRYHHEPDRTPEPRTLPVMVYLANIFSKKKPEELGMQAAFADDIIKMLDLLGLSESAFQKTLGIYSGLASDIMLF